MTVDRDNGSELSEMAIAIVTNKVLRLSHADKYFYVLDHTLDEFDDIVCATRDMSDGQ